VELVVAAFLAVNVAGDEHDHRNDGNRDDYEDQHRSATSRRVRTASVRHSARPSPRRSLRPKLPVSSIRAVSAGRNRGISVRTYAPDAGIPTWVLPSTSGAATGFWDAGVWHPLALAVA